MFERPSSARATHPSRSPQLEADQATRAKHEFLATMSHEMRTPLQTILGMNELLLDTTLSPKQREFARAVHGAGQNLLAQLNSILDFSNLQAGQLHLESRPFRPLQIAEQALNQCRPQAAAKSLELIWAWSADVPDVLTGDGPRLQQVLQQLLGNAVKFTRNGHILLELTCELTPPAPPRLCLRVHDTGAGIAETMKPKLFQSFTQGDASTTRRHGGIGLGLALSKGLIDRMGGRIRCASHVNEGSVFTVELPLTTPPTAPKANPTVPGPPPSRRILVAEDNPATLRVMTDLLTRAGLHCTAVPSVERTVTALQLAAARGERFQWLLLDDELAPLRCPVTAQAVAAAAHAAGTRIVRATIAAEAKAGPLLQGAWTVHKPLRPGDIARLAAVDEGSGSRRAAAPFSPHAAPSKEPDLLSAPSTEEASLHLALTLASSLRETVPINLAKLQAALAQRNKAHAIQSIEWITPALRLFGDSALTPAADQLRTDLQAGRWDAAQVSATHFARTVERSLHRLHDQVEHLVQSSPAGTPLAAVHAWPQAA